MFTTLSKDELSSKEKIKNNNLIFLLNKENETADLIGNDSNSDVIFIPRSITFENKEYFITSIHESAFKNSTTIKTIQFPNDSELRVFEKEAFAYSSIESLAIPFHVTQISDCVFSHCKKLKYVDIHPNSELRSIGRRVFYFTSIESINIPIQVTEINELSFACCKFLKHIEFHPNSQLQAIYKFGFSASAIESISIPSKVIRLSKRWCAALPKLKKNYSDE